MRCILLASCAALATAVTSKFAAGLGPAFASSHSGVSYEEFRKRHGHRRYETEDTASYLARRDLYHSRLAEIKAHNAQRRSWVAGVNKFADFTDSERQALLGYKRWARSANGPSAESPMSFLQLQAGGQQIVTPTRVAAEVDWRSKLKSSSFFRDQGSCGSCWAVAAVGALEMQAEHLTGNTTQLSYQQLVDCVPNPNHCGGKGGCEGATAELAFEYTQTHGLGRADDYSSGVFGPACQAQSSPAVASVVGWQRLPENTGEPLRRAVAQHGPVVVSVDGSQWFGYDHGVFDGCKKDAVVNHAVLTIGYGKDRSQDGEDKLYWLIRNSWGQDWGEGGHIRLLRHTADDAHCGIDRDPKEGVGCDGGPAELPVCGMCGILSDSSHPVGSHVSP